MRDALHEGLVALYGECHHDRGEASDCDVLVAALAARSEPMTYDEIRDAALANAARLRRSEPGAEGLRERIEGLRDRAQRQGTWGIEYGDDRFMADVLAALAETEPKP